MIGLFCCVAVVALRKCDAATAYPERQLNKSVPFSRVPFSRAKAAARAHQAGARQQSEADYQAANRLQQERTGGDACAAATTVIDQELGL